MIKEAVQVLVDFGLLDVVLPFVFVFALSYAMLERTRVLGPDGSRYNGIVAFVLGFAVVAALQLVNILRQAMQWFAVAVVLLSMALVVRNLLGDQEKLSAKSWPKVVSLVVVSIIALYALGVRGLVGFGLIDNVLLPILIAVVVLGAVLYIVMFGLPKGTAQSGTGSGSTGAGTEAEGAKYLGRVKNFDEARDL